MATKEELDAALQELATDIGDLITEQRSAFDRLEALILAGGTPADLQVEFDKIKALDVQIDAAIAVAKGEGVPPPPPPQP